MTGKLAVIMSIYKSDDPEALRVALDSLINQIYPCDIFVYQDGEIPLALTSVIQNYVDNRQIKLRKVRISRSFLPKLTR
ncbi:hypothetical protein I4P28_19820 [Enterobacter kobei]|uniref:hypothetical protein n=1 Tax=Enterobacter kobei TaxID=208224 RepID=UPI0018C264B4|nr:hypothetical protein [Enterobacter kobei]MBG0644585.1 hypothetical protein [Enterobacter kobei]